ncbi:uncharacterized protein LOC116427443 [Nomia melanderi]|uniref:uncharacterized protein LOC116427443 n=1 Tax=Nomia melanderi TaxID=2448451 RepID=UPI00130404E5|nr:uncharacterized protein LOC116427443 [Nomia melanderi]
MDDLEQQCEDALFELCDARERYPLKCAKEFRKCIQLKNEIQMTSVIQKSNVIDDTLEQSVHVNGNFNKKEVCFEYFDYKLQNIINKLDNLKAVKEQINREKTCEINKLLKN